MNGNMRSDLLRQSGAPPTMLGGVGPPFMQGMPSSSQQQLPPNHLGLPSNGNASNPAMMLNNPASSVSAAQQQRYQALQQQQQQGEMRQRQLQHMQQQMRQAAVSQHMMVPGGSSMSGGGSGPHIGALSHTQGMPFNPSMMNQPPGNNGLRRVSSQPSINPGSGPLGGMSPNMVNNTLGMGMNPPPSMTQSQMRQIPPQLQHQLRLHSQQQQLQNQMGPDMPLTMNRPVGNPGMPSGRAGPTQTPLMNNLSQPPSLPQQMGLHQNQFPNSMQIPSQHQAPQMPSPRAGSRTPNMPMATSGPSQTQVNRLQMNPDDSPMAFMNFPNSQFPPTHNSSRMPPTSGQFPPFVPPSGSPIPMSDISQSMSTGLGASGSNPTRPGFHLTPAQQLDQMRESSENYSSHFSMPPPAHVPPRPPSHGATHPPLLQQHPVRQSPHPLDPNPHPPRPHSQPQAIPRPSSQQQAHTPRSAHSQIPPPNNRAGMQPHGPPQPNQQIQIPGPSQSIAMTTRPPPAPTQLLPQTAGSSSVPPTPVMEGPGPSDAQPPAPGSIPRPLNAQIISPGIGQGLTRLLQFSGVLSSENQQKLQLSYWRDTIAEYFTPRAIMKFTFWKDSQRSEAKVFDIGVPILPRFFLVTTQSGVKSMTLSLDGARERIYASGHTIVECVGAVWTYKYTNGYTVVLRGPLTAHVVSGPFPPGTSQANGLGLRFEDFQFDANSHEKYIALESITGTRVMGSPKPRVRSASTPTPNGTSTQQQLEDDMRWEEPRIIIERAQIPGEPVNAFGIPQATMRCLELAESVAQMGDLIAFSTDAFLGPLEALKKYAAKLKEMHAVNPLPLIPPSNLINGAQPTPSNLSTNPFPSIHSNSGVNPTPAITLYSSAPPSVTNPPPNSAPSSTPMANSPKNPASGGSSPQKQHKTIPTQQQATTSSSSTVVTSPTVSSGATTNTPALSNASLKRKQNADTTSPSTATEAPPLKRQTRKRRTTGGNA